MSMKIRRLTLTQAEERLRLAKEKCPGSRYEQHLIAHIAKFQTQKKLSCP